MGGLGESPRHSINGASPTRERSRDKEPSFSRSRSRSGERNDSYKERSARRSGSPKYSSRPSSRNDRHREDNYSSRKRSRSPSYSRDRKSSRNNGDRDRDRRRSRSYSPRSSRKPKYSDREEPSPSKCIGIFGLSYHTTERDLRDLFSKYGQIDKVQVILDTKTGRSRGFAFIYFEHVEDATEAKEQCTGMDIDRRQIRIDFSITKRAHTPTPGIYMGRPTEDDYGRRGGYGGGRQGGGYGGGYGGGRQGGGYGGGRQGGGYRGGDGGGRQGGGYRGRDDGGRHGGGYSGGRRERSPSPYQHRERSPPRRSYRSRSRSYHRD